MIRFNNIKIREDLTEKEIINHLCKKQRLFKENIKEYHIHKRSISSRSKKDVHYNYIIDLVYESEYDVINCIHLKEEKIEKIIVKRKTSKRPIIIERGPAVLFAALTLIENGIKPIIFEQGDKIEERSKKVDNFRNNRVLDTSSNIQFAKVEKEHFLMVSKLQV